jgi:hypothetical protein
MDPIGLIGLPSIIIGAVGVVVLSLGKTTQTGTPSRTHA